MEESSLCAYLSKARKRKLQLSQQKNKEAYADILTYAFFYYIRMNSHLYACNHIPISLSFKKAATMSFGFQCPAECLT